MYLVVIKVELISFEAHYLGFHCRRDDLQRPQPGTSAPSSSSSFHLYRNRAESISSGRPRWSSFHSNKVNNKKE